MSATVVPASAKTQPQTHTIARSVTWKSAVVVSLGGSLLVATSLGAIAADLGPASVFVWTIIALIGVLQCLMIAEMAGMFPDKSGGTATYCHEAFKKRTPLVGAFSNWGYWFAWIPVIPVNMILVGGYIKASFFPHINVVAMAVALTVLLYIVNYFGIKPGIWSSVVMAVCSAVPFAVIVMSPIFRHSLFHAMYVFPFVPLHGSWHSGSSWMLIFKWMFVAAWSGYAFESASTTIAEMKNPQRDAPKALVAASAIGLFAFGLVPFVLLAIVGVGVITQDPSVAFLPAAQAIFGHAGGLVVSIMLITALLLGVQTTIIGSTRCVYEMSRDGQIIKQFGAVNKFKVPVGSMYLDMAVTIGLLIIFKDNIVNLIAASNVGYMVVWMLLPIGYLMLRYQQPNTPRPFNLPNWFMPIAAAVCVFNWILMFLGGLQWGKQVMLTGTIIQLLFVPFYLYRRYVQDKRPQLAFAGGGLPELAEGQDDLGGRREVIHAENNEGKAA